MGAMPGPRVVVGGQMTRTWRSADPDAATLLALQRIAAGADLIKIFGSTGSGANLTATQTFTYDELAEVVDVAHRLGKRVAVHSYGPEAARDAVRAGADSIEHAADLDAATLAEMARRRVYYVPTVDHNRYYAAHSGEFRYTDQDVRNLNGFIVKNLETLRRAISARVPIAMGSDAVFTMFGENTRELRCSSRPG
jgi:imidazolonepropionase-like amidohydrolase